MLTTQEHLNLENIDWKYALVIVKTAYTQKAHAYFIVESKNNAIEYNFNYNLGVWNGHNSTIRLSEWIEFLLLNSDGTEIILQDVEIDNK